jgi:hypothetical protein
MKKMNKTKCLIVTALFAGIVDSGPTLARAQSLIFKEIATPGSYCHMKFPAIREDTPSESTPGFTVSGDLIDFYGACDYDPLGKEEVQTQRLETQHRFGVDFED